MAISTTTPDTSTPGRAAAATVLVAPAVFLVAAVSHPFIEVLPDAEAVGAAVQGGTTRWAVVHLLTAVASGLMALAFLAVRDLLREAGEDRSSRWGLPFVVFGSVMYAVLPGLEFAPLAASETGGDVVAAQAALEPWFVPLLATSVLTYAIGVFGFARAVRGSAVLGRAATQTVVGALVIMAMARAVPVGVVQFHVQGLAGVVALWPLGVAMWLRAGESTIVRRPLPAS